MARLLADRGIRTFLLVSAGQMVSLVGSGLTAFALGVWIYQRTDSTTQYALLTLCAALPPLVVLPLAGPLVDRFDRRRLLIACDATAALATGAVSLLASFGALSLWPACFFVSVTAAASALQWPAWSATVTMLVPRDQLGRASGLTELGMASSQIVAPLLAGALITTIGLAGVTAIDFATFMVSMATLLAAALPAPAGKERRERRSYWRDMQVGWRYIFGHAGLSMLLVSFAAMNFFSELAAILFTPLVLEIATPAALGSILACGGAGMIAGGALLTAWGGPRRPALGALLFAALGGLAVAGAGLTVSVPLLAACAFAFYVCQPLQAGSSRVIWQRTVPPELQGRVFSVRAAIAMSAVPLASLVAGPLADRVFEPAMASNGPLAGLFGAWVGEGDGRGIAFIILGSGGLIILTALGAASYGPLRRLDGAGEPSSAAAPATAGS